MSLPDHAIVVRAGAQVTAEGIVKSIEKAIHSEVGLPVLSVFCTVPSVGESADSALRGLCGQFMWGQIHISDAWTIRHAGFELHHFATESHPETHYHVSFEYPTLEEQVQAYIDAFVGPYPNPVAKEHRRRT